MNTVEYIRQEVESAERHFADHIAKLAYGHGLGEDISILDYKKPGTSCYAMRVVFDHKAGCLYISGDLGWGVVAPTCNIDLESIARCFTRRNKSGKLELNHGYFMEKVRATSDKWYYGRDLFMEDFKEHCKTYDLKPPEELIDMLTDGRSDALEVNSELGITLSAEAVKAIQELDSDYYWVYRCGKRPSARIVLWLVGIRLAWEALEAARTRGEQNPGGEE